MADPKIKYDIEAAVKGEADVNQLASEIDKLAGTLDGDLKTNALAAADALRQLAAKDAAMQNFVDLKREAKDAAAGLQAAQAAAQKWAPNWPVCRRLLAPRPGKCKSWAMPLSQPKLK